MYQPPGHQIGARHDQQDKTQRQHRQIDFEPEHRQQHHQCDEADDDIAQQVKLSQDA